MIHPVDTSLIYSSSSSFLRVQGKRLGGIFAGFASSVSITCSTRLVSFKLYVLGCKIDMFTHQQVDLVSLDDPVWSDTDPKPVDFVRLDELTEDEASQRKVELESQLIVGGACSEEEYGKFKQSPIVVPCSMDSGPPL